MASALCSRTNQNLTMVDACEFVQILMEDVMQRDAAKAQNAQQVQDAATAAGGAGPVSQRKRPRE